MTTTPETLREAQDRFVATWGQMGSAWGISRTMAEAHALLYITGEGLNTDEVMERLQISRGNASMSLRALVDWGLVTRQHKRGDRKEYFLAESDVWTMLRTIVRERMKREIEPLIAGLHEIRDMTRAGDVASMSAEAQAAANEHNKRLDEMLETMEALDRLAQRFASPSGVGLKLAASALAKMNG